MTKLLSFIATPPFSLRLVVFLSCLAALLWGVFRPTSPPDLFEHSDKWIHLWALWLFSVVSLWTFRPKQLWLTGAMLLLFAVLLEVAQGTFQSSRQFDSRDAIGNSLGVIMALISHLVLIRIRHRLN